MAVAGLCCRAAVVRRVARAETKDIFIKALNGI